MRSNLLDSLLTTTANFGKNRHLMFVILLLLPLFSHDRLDYDQLHLNRLERVQNILARVIPSGLPIDPAAIELRSLHWLPVNYRINFSKVITTMVIRPLDDPT